MTLMVSETYVNESKGYQIGDSGLYEPYTEKIGRLFLEIQREYGRCTGKVYIDTANGVKAIGWCFEKRMRYEDARGNDPERDYYLRAVWVTLHDAPDTVTREHHYHTI